MAFFHKTMRSKSILVKQLCNSSWVVNDKLLKSKSIIIIVIILVTVLVITLIQVLDLGCITLKH